MIVNRVSNDWSLRLEHVTSLFRRQFCAASVHNDKHEYAPHCIGSQMNVTTYEHTRMNSRHYKGSSISTTMLRSRRLPFNRFVATRSIMRPNFPILVPSDNFSPTVFIHALDPIMHLILKQIILIKYLLNWIVC